VRRGPVGRLMPGEDILWEGRPDWRALARGVLYIGWLTLYLAAMLIWNAANDRMKGLGPFQTLWAEAPLFVVFCVVLAACAGFAVWLARTTRYVVTNERCVLHYGVAFQATMSLPFRRFAAVSVRETGDGAADIMLTLKPGARVQFLKVWPHVRPFRFRRAVPMLLGVPDGVRVAALISQAAAHVSHGKLHAMPRGRDAAVPEAILAAGD